MRELTLGTAGHIDHGKTALVRALTGIDTDRLEQEKQRGISIDIGFAFLDLTERRLGIVDVPGHERFIKNMLAGASGIDLALLVVAADDSVMPQTREHLAILELLGVKHGLVAITKADAAEPDWIEIVKDDVRELVAGTFLQAAPIVVTSATERTGLDELREALADIASRMEPYPERPFRMCVDRAFVLQGLGTVVTGTVASGAVGTGAELQWSPSGKPLRVRTIQSHGEVVDEVRRGQRTALNVTGAHHSDIKRGHVVAVAGYLRPARRLTAYVKVLPDSPWPLRHRSRVRLHVGTSEVIATVRLLDGAAVESGEAGLIQLICAEPVAAVSHQPLVLRSVSPVRTLGGGMVLQAAAPFLRRRDAESGQLLKCLAEGDEMSRAAAALFFNRGRSIRELDLCREADLAECRAAPVLSQLHAIGTTVVLGDGRSPIVLHEASYDFWSKRVLNTLAQLHEAAPLEMSVPRERIARRMPTLDTEVLDGVLDHMVAQGRLVADGRRVACTDFQPRLSHAQRDACDRVVNAYEQGGFRPPDRGDLVRQSGLSEVETQSLLDLCVEQGMLVRIDSSILLHPTWEQELCRRVTQQMRSVGEMTVSQIKETLETSRKYAVPFCEYLDRIGLTRRDGNRRALARIDA